MDACVHPFWEHRKRTKSNGTIVVAKQCTDCGSSLGEVKKDTFDLSTLKDWDVELVQSRETKRTEENLRAMAARGQQNSEWWVSYNRYLQTEHWRTIRKIVLDRDPMCQICFNWPSSQSHHLTYESFNKIGYSFSVECVGLCDSCHDLIHGRDAL